MGSRYRVSEKNRYTWFFFAVIFMLYHIGKPTFQIPYLDLLKGIYTKKSISNLAQNFNYSFFKKATNIFSCGPYFGIFGMPNVPNLLLQDSISIGAANIFHRKKRNLKSDHALKSYSNFKVATSLSSAAKADFLHNTNRTEKNARFSKNICHFIIH